MLILGIDDAGRGPVIGPMILAGCLADEQIELEFKKIGVRDSKQVLPARREKLAEIIKQKAITFEITLTHPYEITEKNKLGVNLNTIEAQKAAEIINRINRQLLEKVGKTEINKIIVYIDCPSPNIPAWQRTLEKYIKNKENLEIHCEHKADVNHVSCSAASILAKSTREEEVKKIKEKLGVDFGSGYSSDPVTCKFLKEYADKHKKDGIFRETWSTWKSVCNVKKQKKLDEF
ncbi:ribonuclease HII [Candidatus Pacearchaeota archaeon]|nr:ribonuclease HII [Candidatus Pacearchaeota archaeon]